jgi:5-(aminomethyl)-3-furanmethanol phosphate kinase
MRIIKLGGSLLQTDDLPACLDQIAASNQTATLIVTGGGVFADQVRLTQQRWQFNDAAAHQMAILAMQQMAVLINALQPTWPLLASLSALQQWPAQTKIGIWLPELALLNQHAIPANWQVTSDSLAAWLAGMLPVTDLIIVKAAAFSASASYAELVAQGILDQAFLNYLNPTRYTTTIINRHAFITTSNSCIDRF